MTPINIKELSSKIVLAVSSLILFSLLGLHLKAQALTKTTKFNSSGDPVKNIYYNDKLDVVKEEIFGSQNKIVSSIEYDSKGKISKCVGYQDGEMVYNYDMKNGNYFSKEDNVNIKFGASGFEGKEITDGIFVSYKDNEKDGKVILADSAIVGNKIVKVYKVDLFALQHDIIRYYQDFEKAPLIKQFNGYFLTFKNGKLDGVQKSFYSNGHLKFEAEFENGVPKYFNNYAIDGAYISKVVFENGITKVPFILNGTVYKNKWIFVFDRLARVGDIAIRSWANKSEENGSDEENSLEFDNNNQSNSETNEMNSYVQVLVKYKLPRFTIKKIDYDFTEDFIHKYEIKDSATVSNGSIIYKREFDIGAHKYFYYFNPLEISRPNSVDEIKKNENSVRIAHDLLAKYNTKSDHFYDLTAAEVKKIITDVFIEKKFTKEISRGTFIYCYPCAREKINSTFKIYDSSDSLAFELLITNTESGLFLLSANAYHETPTSLYTKYLILQSNYVNNDENLISRVALIAKIDKNVDGTTHTEIYNMNQFSDVIRDPKLFLSHYVEEFREK